MTGCPNLWPGPAFAGKRAAVGVAVTVRGVAFNTEDTETQSAQRRIELNSLGGLCVSVASVFEMALGIKRPLFLMRPLSLEKAREPQPSHRVAARFFANAGPARGLGMLWFEMGPRIKPIASRHSTLNALENTTT